MRLLSLQSAGAPRRAERVGIRGLHHSRPRAGSGCHDRTMTASHVPASAGTDMGGRSPLHPRTLGWVRTAALAMGGSNQSLFLLGALLVAQGSAADPAAVVGLVLGLAAMPGWIELLLMWPNRVGGIAAVCGEAFRPYSAVLANLAGTCYWWGWVPTCGLTVTAVRGRAAQLVSARRPGDPAGGRHPAGVHRPEPAAACARSPRVAVVIAAGAGDAGIPVRGDPRRSPARGLAAGDAATR